MRAFERGAGRDHRPNIGLKTGSSQEFQAMEDTVEVVALYGCVVLLEKGYSRFYVTAE